MVPLRAARGLNEDARTAGARPNRQVTDVASVSAKPMVRQSMPSTSRTGSPPGDNLDTTIGAAHAPKSNPASVAEIASIPLSTSTRRIKRQRSAPIDTRSAIS